MVSKIRAYIFSALQTQVEKIKRERQEILSSVWEDDQEPSQLMINPF